MFPSQNRYLPPARLGNCFTALCDANATQISVRWPGTIPPPSVPFATITAGVFEVTSGLGVTPVTSSSLVTTTFVSGLGGQTFSGGYLTKDIVPTALTAGSIYCAVINNPNGFAYPEDASAVASNNDNAFFSTSIAQVPFSNREGGTASFGFPAAAAGAGAERGTSGFLQATNLVVEGDECQCPSAPAYTTPACFANVNTE